MEEWHRSYTSGCAASFCRWPTEHALLDSQRDTSDILYNLNAKHGLLVEAASGFPVLDFATSRIHWYIAKAGKGSPTVKAKEFVDLLLELDLACKSNGERVVHADQPSHAAHKP